MADIEETTIEVFGTRDVKNKEIYDSYMGILRISPNEVYGTDIDDPTELVNSLYNIEKKERTKIILSDSDGNVFNTIYFQPKAFQQKVVTRDSNTQIEKTDIQDVINMSTIVDTTVYVSNNMKSRSTLLLVRPEKEDNIRHSNFRILSGGVAAPVEKSIQGRGWLLYPTESPNDDNYFNAKNCLTLFDPNNSKSRQEQVEENLFKLSRDEHNSISDSEKVIVGGKFVTNINQYNEDVPVYYTRDYVLGHFAGHNNITETESNYDEAWGTSGLNDEGESQYITKLSWTRIDKLVWDALDEVLTGQIRHFEGRYDGLGKNESADPGLRKQLGFGDSDTYQKFAPILGTEMARGTIMYHAMPFHRYWFHRTRQVLRSLIERKKASDANISNQFRQQFDSGNKSLDDYIIREKGLSVNDSNFEKDSNNGYNLFYKELEKVQEYYENEILTPCSSGTVGFTTSLGKNFALCNGRHLKFSNFPNISPSNEAIFDTKNRNGIVGGIAKFDESYGSFVENTSYPTNTAFFALAESSDAGGFVKLPNLFALFEKTTRFIRGLNWKNDTNTDKIVTIYNPNSSSNESVKSDYINPDDNTSNQTPMSFDEISKKQDKNDIQYSMIKDLQITNKLYFHTFDHLIEKEKHQHNMFSANVGGSSIEGTDSTHDGIFLGYYHCFNTRGGHGSHIGQRFCSTHMGWDRTYSNQDLFRNPSTYNFLDNDDDRWNDKKWLSYCLEGGIYDGGFHKNFTPIPNIGLWLFNSSYFNNKGEVGNTSDVKQRGLHPEIILEINSNPESEKYYYVDAIGKYHYLSETKCSIPETWDDSSLKKRNLEKERMKFFAQKLNEAEGFIPISQVGKASGYVVFAYSRDERRGTKSSSRNTYNYSKYNIAGYKLAAPNNVDDPHNDTYRWRCWSSIPYLNADKLGVWNTEKYIENVQNYDEYSDYYDTNCVTQLPNKDKYKDYYYGGEKINVDENCPAPPHMNLLPLIRI